MADSQELDWRDYHPSYEYSDDDNLDNDSARENREAPHIDGEETQVYGITNLMTEHDVARFLEDMGIPPNYSKIFSENFIDGKEFLLLNADEVKAMIPPIGLAKKIIRLLPSSKHESQMSATSTSTPVSVNDSPPSASSFDVSSNSSLRSSSSTAPQDVASLLIPDNWRPEVMQSIRNKSFSDSARNEVIRSLVNMLFTIVTKPSRSQCDDLAKKFILKYPSSKDELGNGYQSWSDKMVERIRNVIKRDRKRGVDQEAQETPVTKRSKKQTVLLNRYPVTSTSSFDDPSVEEDSESLQEHIKGMKEEMKKAKPRDSLLGPLMKSTYKYRRDFILCEVTPVSMVIDKFPALIRPSMIEQEMGFIFNNKIAELKACFVRKWTKDYVPAVIEYGKSSKKKVLCSLLKDLAIDEEDETSMQIAALKILATALGKNSKSLCYVYEEHGTIENAASAYKKTPVRNQPWIAAFLDESSGSKYVVVCEQKKFCRVSTLQLALFVAFSLYYCFNLEYPDAAKGIYLFFQDFILEQPDRSKKTATYLSITSDIKRKL